MVNKTGKDKIPMLMGQFSDCMEKTKMAIHQMLSERIGDFAGLLNKIDAKLKDQS